MTKLIYSISIKKFISMISEDIYVGESLLQTLRKKVIPTILKTFYNTPKWTSKVVTIFKYNKR